ncbi:MAG TPA: beta-propeller fold lactonase family protein [Acidobacteriaceae bacterium]|nr:beta-propeller fold lactonase family protein [Acidobacteriaceae bacterium]
MKWSQYGRITLALVASLALGLSITACNPSFTLGFVYVLSAKSSPGIINAYTIDSVSGAITQVANSPFSSGGEYPIASVVNNTSKWLYVIHEIDNSVVEFAIGTDGKLYQQHTYNTPGTYPIAVAIDPQSKFLFVVDSFASAFNNSGAVAPNINPIAANPATYGCVVVYPIAAADGSLGTAIADPVSGQSCFPLNGATAIQGSQPIGVTATASVNYLYVADQGTHSIYGYAVNYTNGVLTALTNNSYPAGVQPSAILSDLSGRFVYVLDQKASQILGYTIQGNGSLQAMANPVSTDQYPNSIATDPSGKFLYVTNFNTNSVRAYTIDPVTGNPDQPIGDLSYGAGTGPDCVSVESVYGRFVYVSNYLSNTVSGFELNPQTGELVQILNSPYHTDSDPTCVATAANATHPVATVAP